VRRRRLASIPGPSGITCIYDQTGAVLAGDREHFGFRDGISQPGVRGRLSGGARHFLTRRYVNPSDSSALTHSRPGQPLVWPGQFVFGYPRQDPQRPLLAGPEARAGEDWMRDGSYLVFRRLRQDVPLFRTFVAEQVAELGEQGIPVTAERLAALLVGRWPKGTAVMRNDRRDDLDPMGDRLSVNHFGYGGESPPVEVCNDPFVATEPAAVPTAGGEPEELRTVSGAPADAEGRRCPRFAHVRKVNPRDLTTDKGGADDTLTRTILRRGITWGPSYPDDPDEQAADTGDRGLLFLAYMTSLEDQFETLNDDWMNRASGPEGGENHDLLVGQSYRAPRRGVLRADGGQAEITTERHWVVPTGGGYFFAPSISALGTLAAGD
jgi:Dyp-type peroxidase family